MRAVEITRANSCPRPWPLRDLRARLHWRHLSDLWVLAALALLGAAVVAVYVYGRHPLSDTIARLLGLPAPGTDAFSWAQPVTGGAILAATAIIAKCYEWG